MQSKVLGRTRLDVSELILGTSSIEKSRNDDADLCSILERSVELGITSVYTTTQSEILNSCLHGVMRHSPDGFRVLLGITPEGDNFNPKNTELLRRSVETSMTQLGIDHVDVLLLCDPDRPGQFDWWDDRDSWYGPASEYLIRVKEEHLAAATGLHGTTAYELAALSATGAYDVVITDLNYSLLWREARISLLPEAEKQHMGVVLASTRQRGWLSARYDEEIQRQCGWISPPRRHQLSQLYSLLDRTGITIPALALRWALAASPTRAVLINPDSIEQLEHDVSAAEEEPLAGNIIEEIDRIAGLVPFRPFEEPAACGLDMPYFDRNFTWPGNLR